MIYRGSNGRRVTASTALARIRRLAIPPAWTEVWISRDPAGHLQATGRDARGRKQYRYHPDWRTTRDDAKFNRTIAFGRALPRIRRCVARDLRRKGLGREKVLAAMVRLLETTLIRVGNEEYLRANHSVGLSTMWNRNVIVRGDVLHFTFRGKGGRPHEIDLEDHRLAQIVRRIQELPGQVLFQYVDARERRQKITSTDVNAYLHTVAGAEFSAKDFRTWAGTVLAAVALHKLGKRDRPAHTRRHVVAAIEEVARRLRNTPAICRRCYIHPAVMEGYFDGQAIELKAGRASRSNSTALTGEEKAVLAFLRGRLRKGHRPTAERL